MYWIPLPFPPAHRELGLYTVFEAFLVPCTSAAWLGRRLTCLNLRLSICKIGLIIHTSQSNKKTQLWKLFLRHTLQFTNRKEMLDIDDNGSQVAQNLEMVNTTEASGIVIHIHTHTHTYISHCWDIFISLPPRYSWGGRGWTISPIRFFKRHLIPLL